MAKTESQQRQAEEQLSVDITAASKILEINLPYLKHRRELVKLLGVAVLCIDSY